MNIKLQKDSIYEQSKNALTKLIREKTWSRRNSLMGDKRYHRQSVQQQRNVIQQQMHKMKHQINYRSLKDKSKASPHLKLYVLEQDRNLKKLKIGAVGESEERPQLQIDFSPIQPKGNIQIPDVKELFKHQKAQWLINENKKMRQHINTNIESLQNTLKHLGANQTSRKLPIIKKQQDKQLLSSRRLIKSLQKQKQQINESLNSSYEAGYNTNINMSLIDFGQQRPKQRTNNLRGIKPITIVQKSQNKQMFPSTYLLHQFKNIADLKQKKQKELSSLLKNSYLNRQDILNDKIKFYSKQTQYYDLSPNSQMHLKNIMKKKLEHRLDLSKRQVQLFVDLINQIKASHIMIEQGLVNLLAQIRDELVNGRTIRKKDFQILLKKHQFYKEDSNTKNIMTKLKYMMF